MPLSAFAENDSVYVYSENTNVLKIGDKAHVAVIFLAI